MTIIQVNEKTLTDGSKVYNVVIGTETLPAYDRRHAESLADDIRETILRNAVCDAELRFTY